MDLPIEITKIIFSYLDQVYLTISKRVCCEWYSIINTFFREKSILKRSSAVYQLLEQNDMRNARKLFREKDKNISIYVHAAIKSGSKKNVAKLIREGFDTIGSVSKAIEYHQNDIYVELKMIGIASSFDQIETINLCIHYANIDLLTRILKYSSMEPIKIMGIIINYDQLIMFQWAMKKFSFNKREKEIIYEGIAKTKQIIGCYFQDIRNKKNIGDNQIQKMLPFAEENENYWFFKYGWDFEMVRFYAINNQCNFITLNVLRKGDIDFFEILIKDELLKIRELSFNSIIHSSIPTDTLIKYLDGKYNHEN